MQRGLMKMHYQTWKRRLGLLAASSIRRFVPMKQKMGFGILMYHRIAPRRKGLTPPTWNVTPEKFRSQLTGLLNLGYEATPLRKVLEMHSKGETIPANWFVVTFDDVYENVYTNAWPVLQELQIPATLFLATQYLDSPNPFPFDDWVHKGHADAHSNDWKPITTPQCEEMQEAGLIELGAHTHCHQDFRGRPKDFYQDLLVCKQELKTRFNIDHPTFAFPYGTKSTGFSGGELTQSAKEAGVCCSLTTEDEQVFSTSDPYDWGRFTAEQTDTANTLATKLEGYFTFLKNLCQKSPVPV